MVFLKFSLKSKREFEQMKAELNKNVPKKSKRGDKSRRSPKKDKEDRSNKSPRKEDRRAKSPKKGEIKPPDGAVNKEDGPAISEVNSTH